MPTQLDLTPYTLVWQDNFSVLSLADTATATANWYTRQPWGGGSGSAAFMPSDSGVFSIVNHAGEAALQIAMRRNTAGGLESGLISNVFPDGTQAAPDDGDAYGYYEARIMLPDPWRGIWPAFWGVETERLQTTGRDHVIELDVLEHYGAPMPDRYTSVIHDWDWAGTILQAHTSNWIRNVTGYDVMNTGWHTYGIEITPEQITFYFDRQAFWSVSMDARGNAGSTFGQMINTDFAWMIDLAAGGGWPIDPALGTPGMPANLYVDYVRFYEMDDGAPPPPPPSNQITGTAADQTLIGTAGADAIYGLAGRDTIYGRAGNDIMVGGPGIDTLFGEGGSDTFVFQAVGDSPRGAADVIRDWAMGDQIDLSAIDANIGTAGDQAFTLIGTNQFTGAGQLRVTSAMFNGVAYTLVEANVDASPTPDFAVSLRGAYTLTPPDFIL
jgi:hypothetical protein